MGNSSDLPTPTTDSHNPVVQTTCFAGLTFLHFHTINILIQIAERICISWWHIVVLALALFTDECRLSIKGAFRVGVRRLLVICVIPFGYTVTMRVWEVVCLKRQEYKSKNIIQGHYVDKIAPKLSLWTNSCPFYVIQISVVTRVILLNFNYAKLYMGGR